MTLSSITSLMTLARDLVTALDAGTLREGFHRQIQRGSARGTVAVFRDQEDQLILVVRLSIMEAPRRDVHRFLVTLLQLNHSFFGRAAFSVDDHGTVHLTSGRPVSDLNESEVLDLLLWTSEQADHYDDVLMEAFPK